MLIKKTYGIDLGSSTIKVYSFLRNKTYLEKRLRCVKGRRSSPRAMKHTDMFEKSPVDIVVNSPMAFGMIANLELQEIALYSMMKKIDKFLGIGSDIFFSVPPDMTAVEKERIIMWPTATGSRRTGVYMVEAPIADALALGITLEDNPGSMVVNIGAQSTQVSIITDGKIIISKKIPIEEDR